MSAWIPPYDWRDPEWDVYDKVHGWRNYASKELQKEWASLPDKLKMILSTNFEEIAGQEEWD